MFKSNPQNYRLKAAGKSFNWICRSTSDAELEFEINFRQGEILRSSQNKKVKVAPIPRRLPVFDGNRGQNFLEILFIFTQWANSELRINSNVKRRCVGVGISRKFSSVYGTFFIHRCHLLGSSFHAIRTNSAQTDPKNEINITKLDFEDWCLKCPSKK